MDGNEVRKRLMEAISEKCLIQTTKEQRAAAVESILAELADEVEELRGACDSHDMGYLNLKERIEALGKQGTIQVEGPTRYVNNCPATDD